MRRKQKFSKNWIKAKARVQKIHSTIAHVRRDFLHKTSPTISKNHALVILEDLNVAHMSRSAKGSKAVPGKNVRAKSGLNRAILDQGWTEFRRQWEYKEGWLGGMVLAVPAPHTSQRCACCGHAANAADNASSKMFAAEHAVLACGEPAQQGCLMKQEPAEATRQKVAHA